jgi:hypothetical protein
MLLGNKETTEARNLEEPLPFFCATSICNQILKTQYAAQNKNKYNYMTSIKICQNLY